MLKVILVIAAIIIISLVFYLTLKRKVKCSKCKSFNLTATGQKRYKEDNLAIHGSPSSSHGLEYKCSNTFWEPKQSVIFN